MKYFVESPTGWSEELDLKDLGEGQYLVRVGDQVIHANIADIDRLGQYSVTLDHVPYAASIESGNDPTDLHVGISGGRWHFQIRDEREEAAGQLADRAGGKAEMVKAQMPGLVVNVHVELGQICEPGQAVLVLEAMKMQNEVETSQGGRVAEILVEPGTAVEHGAPLIRMEPVPEN